MTRTHFLTAAYAVRMEILVLLLLLTSLDKDSDITGKLRSALAFYRENRELITMLTGAVNAAQPAAATGKESADKTTESRPSEKVDSLKILEEYLSRSAV